MKEYNNFPKEVKEKIIAQRDRYVEYEKLAYEQGLRYTPQITRVG